MKTKTIILLIAGYAAIAAVGLTATAMAAEPTAASMPAPSFFLNGNKLFSLCKENRAYCVSYITGVSDSMEDVGPYLPAAKACAPEGVTGAQIADVVIKYMTEHPATRHYSASSQVALALWDAFPCAQQAPKVGS